ncbi:MAG: peptide deformylase [Candidatus Lambdaproteobacteria bacterium]|nr:peptide deformylase [Candidatus Lambdaproteobacteria bacterium]
MSDEEQKSESLPPLVTMGHPRLARPSRAVPKRDIATPAFQARLETLHRAMVAYLGIGIAAPQIGWFERFFLMTTSRPGPDGEPEIVLEAWINPRIVSASSESNWAWEGCLSVPGLRGWIRRPAAVAVRGFNHLGEAASREYAGWDARVFQHEYDHLDGLLFPYRAADPRHIVTLEALAAREAWPADWPAPGARDTPLGDVLPE